MQTVFDSLIALVGQPPAGYDILVWVIAAVFTLFLVSTAFSILFSFISWIGGK